MIFIRLYEMFANAKRLLEILWVICIYYFISVFGKNKFTRKFISKKYKTNGSIISHSSLLRISIEKLGPTYVKFGQFLAERSDILSDNMRTEFKKLHASVKPFDDDIAFQIVEKELRGSIDEHFNWVNSTPIASASIGQVYRAEMKNGEQVVIKIQRPNIENKIKQDLILLKLFFKKMKNDFSELNAVNMDELLEEFGKNLIKELNYVNEANNITRFQEMMKDISFCKIPKLQSEYVSKKMLIMEYIEGIHLSEIEGLEQQGYNTKWIANNLLEIFLHMILKHGFFHADPHKGNIIIQKDNSVALIDFGSVGNIKPSQIDLLVNMVMGITNKRPKAVAEALTNLCGAPTYKDIEDIEFGINTIFKSVNDETGRKQMSNIITECIELLVENKMQLPTNIVLLFKALMTVENNIKLLDSEIDITEKFKPYAKEILVQKLSIKNVLEDGFYSIKKYLKVIKQLPNDVTELVENLKNGKLIHDVRFTNDGKFNHTVKHIGNMLTSVILTGFVLIGATILMSTHSAIFFSKALFMAASVNAIWLMFKIKSVLNDR